MSQACDALRSAAEAAAVSDAAAIERIRRCGPAEIVRLALDLAAARRRMAGRFDRVDRLVADPIGVEQATSADVATHKAKRFHDAGVGRVVDLCCGIGGDAMALATDCDVWAIDADPARAWMARHNVEAVTGRTIGAVAADVATLPLCDRVIHLDPSRRDARGRHHRYADYQPGPAFIADLLRRCPTGAVKLGPGVDFADLPPGEVELISRRGTLVQAVLWTGRLARHERTATCLPAGESLHGPPGTPRIGPMPIAGQVLHTVDPAAERAELLHRLAATHHLTAPHPRLGLLVGSCAIRSPWLTPFELVEALPWRLDRLRDALRRHDAGLVEVKTRDKAVDPDAVQRQLRGEGTQPLTVFIYRVNRKVIAWIARRVS